MIEHRVLVCRSPFGLSRLSPGGGLWPWFRSEELQLWLEKSLENVAASEYNVGLKGSKAEQEGCVIHGSSSHFPKHHRAPASERLLVADSRSARRGRTGSGAEQPKFDTFEIDTLDPGAGNGIVFLVKAYQQPAYFVLRAGITPDRSQPPVGAYCVWKDYRRSRDRSMLEWAYPRLVKWHEWWFKDRGDGQPWRDGNRDGLLEWGSDRGSGSSVADRGVPKAPKWEMGMDDSRMYDDVGHDEHAYSMKLDDVWLNSLYTLDAECLAKIAAILGKVGDSKRFAEQNARMQHLSREKMWNEQDGIYESVSWNGQFLSTRFQKFAPVFRANHTELAIHRQRSGSFRVRHPGTTCR